MALFQKKPQVSSSAPLYTLGLNKTILIVGLGNPGKDYQNSRHNIGFACVESFVELQELGNWIEKRDLKCLYTLGTVSDKRVIVIKPTTFMNLSGAAVQAVAHFYKVKPVDIVVVHDELDIEFGQIRTRLGGSDAGHNGIKSIIERIGDDFGRIRIGIANSQSKTVDSADFVLNKFTEQEQSQLKLLNREVTAILTEYLFGGSLPQETRSFIN
jgi:peptidyl-tRNA hydrolase, PTH1 family